MHKILKVLFLLSISFTANSYDQAKLMKAWSSVVMIRGYTDDGSLAYGSGVIVGKNEVVTNCHVLRKTKQPWVSQGDTSFHIESVQANRWQDLCLLTLFQLNRDPVPIGNSNDLVRGQELAGIGHSGGSPVPLTSGGYMISTYNVKGGNIILSSAKFRLGASGSGLFDMNGNLVGINTFKTTGYGSYFSMPAEWIHQLRKEPMENFPIIGKALWEEEEDNKPYFLKIAIPKAKESWDDFMVVTTNWIAEEKSNTEAWYEHGFANEMLKNFTEALKAYKKSLDLDSTNSNALFRIGIIQIALGEKDKAKQVHTSLTNLDPARADELDEIINCINNCK